MVSQIIGLVSLMVFQGLLLKWNLSVSQEIKQVEKKVIKELVVWTGLQESISQGKQTKVHYAFIGIPLLASLESVYLFYLNQKRLRNIYFRIQLFKCLKEMEKRGSISLSKEVPRLHLLNTSPLPQCPPWKSALSYKANTFIWSFEEGDLRVFLNFKRNGPKEKFSLVGVKGWN